jgi:hypothetical protein
MVLLCFYAGALTVYLYDLANHRFQVGWIATYVQIVIQTLKIGVSEGIVKHNYRI